MPVLSGSTNNLPRAVVPKDPARVEAAGRVPLSTIQEAAARIEGFGRIRSADSQDRRVQDIVKPVIPKVNTSAVTSALIRERASTAPTSPSNAPVPVPQGGNTIQNNGNVRGMLLQAAAQAGWTGQQAADLLSLVQRESSFRPDAQNPSSTAYGLFQFLDSTWAGTGVQKTSDPLKQILAGFKYIQDRYGDPSSAMAFHRRNGWY